MPATRSRTSTEAPEVAVEEVKKSEDLTQNEEVKDSTINEKSEDNNENTTSSTTDEKEENEVESEENGSNDANEVNEAKDKNGDKTEEKVENGSAKRKSEVGDGDGPDSTDITPKKVKVDEESSDGVAADPEAPQLEATV